MRIGCDDAPCRGNGFRTFIRRFRHVRQPVLVLRLMSFLVRPPGIILPSEAGSGYRSGWLGSEVTLMCGGGGASDC